MIVRTLRIFFVFKESLKKSEGGAPELPELFQTFVHRLNPITVVMIFADTYV